MTKFGGFWRLFDAVGCDSGSLFSSKLRSHLEFDPDLIHEKDPKVFINSFPLVQLRLRVVTFGQSFMGETEGSPIPSNPCGAHRWAVGGPDEDEF